MSEYFYKVSLIIKENTVACLSVSAVSAAQWDPGGKRLNFFSGKQCRVYGGGREAHTDWRGVPLLWMKSCVDMSRCVPAPAWGSIRGDIFLGGKKWWKSSDPDLLDEGGPGGLNSLKFPISSDRLREKWSEIMWLRGRRPSAWTTAWFYTLLIQLSLTVDLLFCPVFFAQRN